MGLNRMGGASVRFVGLLTLAGLACAAPANIVAAEADLSGAGRVGPAHSAQWFNPERSGEGWSLEIIGPDTAAGYWFTYDEQGEQRWLVGLGRISGDRIDFPEMQVTSGGRFGPDFDPDEVVREVVGPVAMVFTGCNEGWFEFSAFGQTMTIDLVRLTNTLLLECEAADQGSDDRGMQSGSWYDPTHSGEGFSLQWMSDGRAVTTWFSYDTQGRQYWMQGLGETIDGKIVFPEIIATAGARFGGDFDPNDVVRFPWGELTMELGCQSGTAEYHSILPEFGSGTFQLRRLTMLDGLECPPDQPDIEDANWTLLASSGPALSELPAVTVGDHIYVAGGLSTISSNSRRFWRYTPATDTWTLLTDMPGARDHGMMAALGGQIYFFGGNSAPLTFPGRNTWRFDPGSGSWTALADMPAARSAGGAAALGEHIYVAGGKRNAMDRYTPSSNTWTSIPLNDPWERDHASVVAYRDEIWILGGRSAFALDNSGEVLIFDPLTGAARRGPPMIIPRSGFSVTTVAGNLVAAGGEDILGGMISEAEAFTPESGWRLIEPLPVAVHGAGATVYQGDIYVMLGSVVAGDIFNRGHVQVLKVGTP